MGDEPPPPHPEVVLAPPEGFEPPEDMPPPMTGDPEADAGAMLDTFFQLMDADGSGAVDFEEFKAWVHHVHMPPPGDMMEEGMPPGDPPMGDD